MDNDNTTIAETLFVDKSQKTAEDIINKLEQLKTNFHQLSLKKNIISEQTTWIIF